MRRLLQTPAAILAACLLAMLTACSSLGLVTPSTFNERIASAVATVTQVRASATDLLVAKRISADDAEHVQAQADNAMAALTLARQMHATDPAGANARLTATITALTALQTYLRSREAP